MSSLTDVVKHIEDTSNNDRVHKVYSVSALVTAGLVAGQSVNLIEYHEGTTVGGGSGVIATARHNGGTAISLTRTFPTDWGDNSTGAMDDWFADSGNDELCFIRADKIRPSASDFGVHTSFADNYLPMYQYLNKGIPLAGGTATVTSGSYTFSKSLIFAKPINFIGSGAAENPTVIFDFTGATLYGDGTNDAGVILAHPTIFSGITKPTDLQQNVNGGIGSSITGIIVKGSSGDGIWNTVPAMLSNVLAVNNTGHGINETAGSGFGNANHSLYLNCKGASNGKSGLYLKGNDANTFTVVGGMFGGNGHYGVYDGSLLGGTITGTETDGNTLGGFVSSGVAGDIYGGLATPARTVLTGTYAEPNQPIFYGMNKRALILNATGAQPGAGQSVVSSLVDKGIFMPRLDIADDENGAAGSVGSLALTKNGVTINPSSGEKGFFKVSGDYIELATDFGAIKIRINSNFNSILTKGSVYFPSGFVIGGSALHKQVSLPAIPTTGLWGRGTIAWNQTPVSGGFVGWVCVATGEPGTWVGFGAIA